MAIIALFVICMGNSSVNMGLFLKLSLSVHKMITHFLYYKTNQMEKEEEQHAQIGICLW